VTRRVHEHLVEERHEHVALLRVEREEALGALSRSMMEALLAYAEELAGDEDVAALVLTGTGRGFVAGADVAHYRGASGAAFDAYQRIGRRAFAAVAALPQPTIAAVNGYALGGGFELALCCDLIVASHEAVFGLPEVKLGLLPGGGGSQRLARAVGTRLAKELLMTGRSMKAEEADRRGLLSRVVEPAELQEAALDLARRLAERPRLAVREAKRLVDDGVEMALDAAWTFEQRVLSALFATDDAREGIEAFLDKRRPAFHGR
jgi:enoyl-CoA hydratase